MRKLGWALAFHRDEDEMESLRNPAAPQSIGMAARPRGWLGTWEPAVPCSVAATATVHLIC